MEVRRGDLVTVALQGDYGKPRPALVIQADQFVDLGSVVILPITSTLVDAPLLRPTVEPSPDNGLRHRGQWIAHGVTDHVGQAGDGEGRQDRCRLWPPR